MAFDRTAGVHFTMDEGDDEEGEMDEEGDMGGAGAWEDTAAG